MKKCLVALAFGTLGLGMSEFGMMGILTFVASGLHVSIPQAGHLVSAYALGVCIGAPLTVAVAHTRPLKQILLALAGLMVAGNLCAAFAPNYGVLLAMRFVSGLPHGAYFGVGSIVAARVAGPGRSAQAVAVMIAGMTVANLFGVPLGTLVSHLLSWRALFCIAGVWGAVTAFFLWRWVPWMEPVADSRGLKGQFAFLRNRAPWLIILATMFGNGGIFCMYSYVSPLMIRVAGFSPEAMTLVILLAGLGMFVGNLVSGGLSDRYTPERVARFAQGIAVVALALILFLAANRWAALTLYDDAFRRLVTATGVDLGKCTRRSDVGSGVDSGGVQPGKCLGRVLRRLADRIRSGLRIFGVARRRIRAVGIRDADAVRPEVRSATATNGIGKSGIENPALFVTFPLFLYLTDELRSEEWRPRPIWRLCGVCRPATQRRSASW